MSALATPASIHALVPRHKRASATHELNRRDEEAFDYVELIQGYDSEGKVREPLSKAIATAVLAVINERVRECEKYARVLNAQREEDNAEKFGLAVVLLMRRRLDEVEDIVPFEEVDWRRIRSIIMPEDAGTDTWRRLAAEGWLLWRSILRGILPEVYGDPIGTPEPSTGAVHRTPQRVEVLAKRYLAGLPLYHDEDQLEPGPGEALEPLEVAGNGRKAPSTVDGAPVQYRLVQRGEQRGKDVVRQDEGLPGDWRKPCLAVLRAEEETPEPPVPDEPQEVAQPAPPTPEEPQSKRRKREPIEPLPEGRLVQGTLF